MQKESWARVVLVDDNRDVLRTVSLLLGRVGLEAVPAASGPEGLEAMERVRPDLVLLDNDMPGMRGLEVLRIMKEDTQLRHIPVLSISGDVTHNFLAESQRLGLIGRVAKPFETMTLLRAVLKALGRPPAPEATLQSLVQEYSALGK